MSTKLDPLAILIVEDDSELLAEMVRIISEANPDLRIQTLNTGKSVVDVWEKGRHAVVLLDLMLPQKSGFLVLEKLLFWRESSEIRPFVVMITAHLGKRHEEYARKLGVDEYHLKPVKREKLLELVSRALEAAEKRNEESA